VVDLANAPLRTLIVDDEHLARRAVRRLLKDEADVDIVGEAADGTAAVQRIAELSPDVVCLDIRMPGLSGFDVLRALPESERPFVLFMTAYDEHAIRAFDSNAVDYLVKPIDAERARRAFARIRTLQSQQQRAERYDAMLDSLKRYMGLEAPATPLTLKDERSYASRVLVRKEGSISFVMTADIDWIEASRNYMKLHVGNTVHVVRDRLHRLYETLDPRSFARVHRSTVVNLNRIKEIQPWFSGDFVVILRSGVQLRMSRHFRESLEQQLRA
jgi:two-component system LytT family response regulator